MIQTFGVHHQVSYNEDMKSSQYVALFLDEAQLLLDHAQSCLDELPAATAPVPLQQELFRLLHTLKGMASTLVDFPYFGDFTQLSHALENLLDGENLDFDGQSLLQEGLSSLQTLNQNIAHPQLQLPLELAPLLQQLEQRETTSSPTVKATSAALPAGLTPEIREQIAQQRREDKAVHWLEIELMPDCLMKSVRAMLVLHNLKEEAELLYSEPPLSALQQGDFDTTFRVLMASQKEAEHLKAIAEGVSEIESVTVEVFIEPDPSPPESAPFAFELNEFESKIIQEAQKQSFQAVWLRFEMTTHPLPFLAARIALAFRALEESGEIIKTMPDVMALEAEEVKQGFEILMVTAEDAVAIRERLNQEKEIQLSFQVKARPYSAEHNTAVSQPAAPRTVLKAALQFPEKTVKNPQSAVRVDYQHLEKMQSVTANLLSSTSPSLSEAQAHPLYQAHFALRFIPASTLFGRYPLIIKELERALHKQIQLTFSGEHVRLPRKMADPLANILLHLIRNAADHGLEVPEVRQHQHKPLTGKIHLSVELSGERLAIEVRDDGCGISIEKLKQGALDKALITAEQATEMSDEAALELVFAPGLSTADNITSVSGRGVGMDTVRTQVEQLQGQIEVHSETGVGSRFRLIFPTSLHSTSMLIMAQGEHHYALPAEQFVNACFVSEANVEALFSLKQWDTVVRAPLSRDICVTFEQGERKIHVQAEQLVGLETLFMEQLFSQQANEEQADEKFPLRIHTAGISATGQLVRGLSF